MEPPELSVNVVVPSGAISQAVRSLGLAWVRLSPTVRSAIDTPVPEMSIVVVTIFSSPMVLASPR